MVNSPTPKLKLTLHPDFKADLDDLWRRDLNAAAEISVLLELIEDDQSALSFLTTHKYVYEGNFRFDVIKWVEMSHKGLKIWRLKFLDPGSHVTPYRLIYAFDQADFCYDFLAIVPRTFAYDANSQLGLRIAAAYKGL